MDKTHVYDMVIVGGGPGGYTAALYAARAGLDTLVLEKLSPGGQMAQTDQIDNYPRLRGEHRRLFSCGENAETGGAVRREKRICRGQPAESDR